MVQYLPVPSSVSEPVVPPKWKSIYKFAIYITNNYVHNVFERNLVNIELGNRHIV